MGGIPISLGVPFCFGGIYEKEKRNPKATAKDYSKFYGSFAGHTVADMTTPEYYGLMKKRRSGED